MNRCHVFLAFVLFLNLTTHPLLAADKVGSHLITLHDLQSELSIQSARRTAHIEEIQSLISHELVQKYAGNLVNLDRISLALPGLDDATLQQLAADSRDLNSRLGAGLSTVWIVLIVAGIVALVAVLATASGGTSGASGGG